MAPEDVVRAVLDRIHESDPSVMELFAEDAVRHGQDGRVMEGRAAIGEYYASLFPSRPPFPILEYCLVNPPFVAGIIRLPGETEPPVRYVDLFEVRDGLVQSVRVLVSAERFSRG